MFNSLSLKSENSALEVVNRLEGSILVWKERITDQASGKSPARRSWSFVKDPISELDKLEFLLSQAEALVQQLKFKYPNLPQTFINVTKIQYGMVRIVSTSKICSNATNKDDCTACLSA